MADNVEVKLGADTAAAQSSFEGAASSIAASLAGIQKALEGMTQTHAKVPPAIEKNNNAIVRSFKEMQTQIAGAYEGIQRAGENFNKVMIGLSLLLAGGALWRESVGQMLHFEQEVLNLENVMGMLSDKATETAVALKIIGSNSDAYTGIALKMGRQLKSGGEEMERLGVSTKDAAGNLLPMDTIMQNAFATMQTYKSGTDQAEFALSVFGRSVQDVYNIMARLPAAQERAKELMHDLNIEMGPERQQEIERYRLSVGSFSVVLEEIGIKIGEAVLPNLEGLAAWFNERGPAAVNAIVTAFKLIPQVFEYISAGFQRILANLAYLTDDMVDSAKTLWRKLVAVTTVGGETLVQIQDAYNKRRLDNERRFADELVAIEANMQANLALLDKKEKPGAPGPGPLGSGPRGFTAKPKAQGEVSVMANLENALKEQENAYNQMKLAQGSFEVWSIAQTRDYWATILQSTLLSTKDRMAAQNKYYDAERAVQQQAFAAHIAGIEKEIAASKYNYAEQIRLATQAYNEIAQRYGAESAAAEAAAKKIIEIRQKQAAEIAKIAELQAKMEESAATFAIGMQEANLQQAVALRRVGAQEMFQIEAQLENQLYSLKVEALAKARALATGDLVKQKELDAQLQTLEQQHQTKLTQIANQAELDRQQFAIQAAEAVESSFGTLLNDLVSRTKTLKQTFLDFTKSLTDSLNKIASQQIAKQLFGAGTGGGGMVSDLMNKIFGGGATGGANSNTGTSAADAALKKLATTTQSTTTDFSAISTVSTSTMTPAFSEVTSAAYAAAAALQAVAASSGGGGGAGGAGGMFGSLFDSVMGGGDSGGLGGFDAVAGYAEGTNYVPRDQLALVHRGEAVIPASMNGKSTRAGGMSVTNNFTIQGAIDGRTQDQIAARAALATQRASYKNL